MTSRWMRIAAVASLEVRVQRREPLTVLYMLVFALLAMAFAASGPVELVRDRGAVPRDAAWSLMLASTAITAFGQVITTMVAATVVLRDRADRVADLLVTTRLGEAEYRVAKLLAAWMMLALIYAAIPFGLVAGAMLGGGTFQSAVRGSVPPFIVVVLPTMLAIGALQFAVGVLSGRLWVIVGQGLLLIWLWTAAVGAVTASGGVLPSLLDPFGSAPLLAATRSWSDAERATRAMPLTSEMVVGRIVWLLLGGIAAWWAIRHRASRQAPQSPPDGSSGAAGALAVSGLGVLTRAAPPRWWAGCLGSARYVTRWMLRDAGWRVLALLGAVNVGVQGWAVSPDAEPSTAALLSLQEHARLFLILLATIYAGELVWREPDEGSAALFDALPVAPGALVIGRIAGVIVAQSALVLLLVLAAGSGVWLATGSIPSMLPILAIGGVWLPFVSWMLLALAVHVVVREKVVGHLLCIAGWALASVRFGAATASGPGAMPAMGWGIVCLLSGCIVLVGWRGGSVVRRR